MTTKWDCVWQDEKCLGCMYYHRMVVSETKPECPRNLDPPFRKIFTASVT